MVAPQMWQYDSPQRCKRTVTEAISPPWLHLEDGGHPGELVLLRGVPTHYPVHHNIIICLITAVVRVIIITTIILSFIVSIIIIIQPV